MKRKKITITKTPAPYVDGGVTRFPEVGDQVEPRAGVAYSLVKGGLAKDGWAVVIDADGVADVESVESFPAWNEIDGISSGSLELLESSAPGENPLTASADSLAEWLGGVRRVKRVLQAIKKWQAQSESSEDG